MSAQAAGPRHVAYRLAAALAVTLSIACNVAAAQDVAIAGIWLPDASRSQRFPAQPPFTDEGRRIVADWRASHDPIEDDPGKFCQAPGMPSLALGGADYPVEVVVTTRQVTILMELHQQVRRVFLDQDAHPARLFPQRNGHSIGRWDGDTLVVDTAGIKAITFGSVPHSDRGACRGAHPRDRRGDGVAQRSHHHRSRDVRGTRCRAAILSGRAAGNANARVRVHRRHVGRPRGRAGRSESYGRIAAYALLIPPQVSSELR